MIEEWRLNYNNILICVGFQSDTQPTTRSFSVQIHQWLEYHPKLTRILLVKEYLSLEVLHLRQFFHNL